MSGRVRLFGVEIDSIRMTEAVERIVEWCKAPQSQCRYVVTPNVDHTVLLQHDASLRAAYGDAAMVLADGWPVVLASRLLGKRLPERAPGSDLAPALFDAAEQFEQPLRVFLLGAAAGVGERAAVNIERRWPHVQITGVYSPPLGFEHDDDENQRILELIRQAAPQVLMVGLGAPKQEKWVHAHRHEISADAALCIGATIDFLAGEKSRAPNWMQRSGLEWLHRMASEPRRLCRRYARDAWVFPQLVWREWRTSH